MVPDLPYDLTVVPDGSEAPVVSSRFAQWRVGLRTRLQLASTSTYALTSQMVPAGLVAARLVAAPLRTDRAFRRRSSTVVVSALVAAALAWSVAAPSARADDLTDQRDQVKQQLAQTKGDLAESSQALASAGAAVDSAQSNLAAAEAELARTQQQLAEAQDRDAAMAKKLKRAKAELAAAKKAVIAGQAKLDAKKAVAGEVVRDQYQQQTNLLPIAVMLQSSTTADLQTRLQWSTTMFDTTQSAIDELTAIQRKLSAEKAKQARLEAEVAADRKEAAANLVSKKGLEARAEAQTATVASMLRQRQAAESAAAQDVAEDKSQYAQLTKERASVEQRIATRIAQAQAAAAKARVKAERQASARRAAAQAAREAAAAKRSAATSKASAAHRKSSQRASAPVRRASSSGTSRSASRSSVSTSGAHHGFSYPVPAPITSGYGMRLHPVLHYWKLHDGTDFGAGCGTAIRAAYSGRVAERYYNAGYGNRLMIDHGMVDGKYVTTGYNHAIRYTVGVGQRVSKGQVIGYVGTTGYSTGCHLHLMVWINGGLNNPMSWY